MQVPAAVERTRNGRVGYGPKCARAMGIMPAHKNVRIKRSHAGNDPAQMELIDEAEAIDEINY